MCGTEIGSIELLLLLHKDFSVMRLNRYVYVYYHILGSIKSLDSRMDWIDYGVESVVYYKKLNPVMQ